MKGNLKDDGAGCFILLVSCRADAAVLANGCETYVLVFLWPLLYSSSMGLTNDIWWSHEQSYGIYNQQTAQYCDLICIQHTRLLPVVYQPLDRTQNRPDGELFRIVVVTYLVRPGFFPHFGMDVLFGQHAG